MFLSRALPAASWRGAFVTAARRPPLLGSGELGYLRELAAAVIESARVRPGEARGGQGPNRTGITLITPGGNYPALWVRDFAMSLDCGLIPPAEVLPQLRLIARCQNGAGERRLRSGAIVPPFAVPDHITLRGEAVFYPGTYSPGEDQGAPPWGPLPPADDHYYLVHIAHALWRDTGDARFLAEAVDGYSLLQRLEKAFAAPDSDPDTGAVVASRERRAVGFGFQDSVYLLGAMSFATLLRWRAARQLAGLLRAAGRAEGAGEYERIAEKIGRHLGTLFRDPAPGSGWLLAATGVGRQPDVWATLFALHLGALPEKAARGARQSLVSAVRAAGHTVEYQGAIRHVPSDRYFRPERCWEEGGGRANTYQSGAFWHTPTGWLIEALRPADGGLARQVADRFLQHLRANDFRQGRQGRAPWECFGIELQGAQNPVYMTSVTLPLSVLQAR